MFSDSFQTPNLASWTDPYTFLAVFIDQNDEDGSGRATYTYLEVQEEALQLKQF